LKITAQQENNGLIPIRTIGGLDIPIGGQPKKIIREISPVSSVALIGSDYLDLRPSVLVEEGDTVKLGQPLCKDRVYPDVLFTSPGNGVVTSINKGAKRSLISIVIDLAGNEEERFFSAAPDELANLSRDQIVDTLLASGMWTAFRTRPFSKFPDPNTAPSSIFVTATDTNPLAAKPEILIAEYAKDYSFGLEVIAHLTEGNVFVCQAPYTDLPLAEADNIHNMAFSGPHPSGLVGTHIHFLDPVNDSKVVWHLGYQDVIAIGKLFTTGKLWVERTISLAGPLVKQPLLVRTRIGANIDDLTRDELLHADCRIISGSVFSGRQVQGPSSYLGRFHNQISVIDDEKSEQFQVVPSRAKKSYSSYSFFGIKSSKEEQGNFTTALNGQPSVFFPLGGFERVMPLDILPTQLLKALLVGDWELAKALGCLELDEEDLALCTFVCPGKCDYGSLLRAGLKAIEKDG